MKRAWGAFALRGSPNGPGLPRWPTYNRSNVFLSLRAGGQSRTISDAQFAAAHQCGYWDTRS
jgi:hypothetical protein